ncbi:MAG: N-acetyltransferase [Planctomycetia bacterium]|nr:N-acetyltransferase [Planctomycetia bacterium]
MNAVESTAQIAADAVIGERVVFGRHVTIYPGVTIGDDCRIFDNAVIGRPPMSAGNTTRAVDRSARPLSIGPGSIIGAGAVLYTGIQIGRQVLIGDLASMREGCLVEDEAVVGRGVQVMYDTTIKARSRIIDGAILTGNMLIEEDVFVGPGVVSINDNDVYLKRFGLAPFSVRGPILRRFCLVGAGANLAAGVEVGEGAIVAPQAMVTRDVLPWTIVAGVPAAVKRSVEERVRRQILEHFAILAV